MLPETLSAQKVKRVSGDYTYYAPNHISLDAAKQIALERVKVQLIANEFGTYIGSSSITRLENTNGESNVQTLSLAGSEVRGEWIETIGDPIYEIAYQDGMLAVKVTISGRIREITSASIDIKTKVLKNGTDDRFESGEFRIGDALYLSFQSPVDGYLTVYLYDGSETVYCLLPYQSQSSGQIKIKADKRYVFFSPEDDIQPGIVDAYVMTCAGEMELNRIYVIFSPHLFTKALTSEKHDVTLPKMLPFADFQKWLGKCRKQDLDMTLNIKDITILR